MRNMSLLEPNPPKTGIVGVKRRSIVEDEASGWEASCKLDEEIGSSAIE